jgi:predicted nucleic-acid-binding protein
MAVEHCIAMATKLIKNLSLETPGFAAATVDVELFWLLGLPYDFNRQQRIQVLEVLLRSKPLILDQAAPVARTSRIHAQGNADFVDWLNERTSNAAGCDRMMTFDSGAAKVAGMT